MSVSIRMPAATREHAGRRGAAALARGAVASAGIASARDERQGEKRLCRFTYARVLPLVVHQNVLWAERKNDPFLTLGARKTYPKFCVTSARVRVRRGAPGYKMLRLHLRGRRSPEIAGDRSKVFEDRD